MNNELNELILDVREHVIYLQELGVDALGVAISEKEPEPREDRALFVQVPDIQIPRAQPIERSAPEVSRLASLPSLTKRKPPVPVRPEPSVAASEPIIEPVPILPTPVIEGSVVTPAAAELAETIEAIRLDIGNCLRCPLHEGRKNIAHSTGNFNADLMFVGEAPGADEDEQGVPFVGRAGKLLTQIIEAIGYKREDVFIGNINRCRPPGNRAPEPAEAAVCKPFLFREIAVVKPRVIVVLGATAAQNLLETKVPIGKLRGQFHEHLGVKVMPTFHPAYLLRDPHKKREVWEDMKMVRDFLNND
jgi:DNA polymerase